MWLRTHVFFVLSFTLTAASANAQFVDDLSHINALAHYREGEALLHTEQFVDAAEEFQAAIKLDPLLTIAHHELGQAYMALRQYRDAIRAYLACRNAFETLAHMVAVNDFAADQRRDDETREIVDSIEQIRCGRIKVATGRDALIARLEHRLADLERMRRRGQPSLETPAELSLALGSAYFRSGDVVSAEREWKAAVAANPRLGEAHNNLAALYAMTGRKEQAQDAVKQAEKAGYRVNPRLKSDIQAMPKQSS
jgi:tetratricopeptide (TPR) repeat protein